VTTTTLKFVRSERSKNIGNGNGVAETGARKRVRQLAQSLWLTNRDPPASASTAFSSAITAVRIGLDFRFTSARAADRDRGSSTAGWAGDSVRSSTIVAAEIRNAWQSRSNVETVTRLRPNSYFWIC
jgi:hypothetical protein